MNRKTRGSENAGKFFKRKVYEKDEDYIPSSPKRHRTVRSKPRNVTRSKVSNTGNCPLRIPDDAAISPPKLRFAMKITETNVGASTNENKQQSQIFTDENQDTWGSFLRYPTTIEQLERHSTVENNDSVLLRNPKISPPDEKVQTLIPSFDSKEKNASHGGHNFHFPEFVNQDPMDENEKVVSTIDQSLISVGEYLVKKEIAPLLEKIISKHKDIAKECVIKNKQSHVPYLEMICFTCQKLENVCLKDVIDTELEDMSMVIEGIQHMGFDMKWLSERIHDISKAKDLVKEYPTIKEGRTKLEMKRKEVDMLKQKLESELLMMEKYVGKEFHDFKQRSQDLKLKGLALWGNSLLSGLI